MKKSFYIILCVAMSLIGCTTYQFSARQVDVNRRQIDMNQQVAGIIVNYAKQVSATSSYQATKKDAIAEAEFMCIQNYKVDVIVDPILKMEYNPWKIKNRYKATIIGFAGMYEEKPSRLDDSKNYTREEIEKYKLLYDASFPRYYYNNAQEGDNYYFNTDKKEEKKSFFQQFKNKKKSKINHNLNTL